MPESSWTTDGKCPGASKSVALWSHWNASHPYRQSLLKKHITDVEDVKEQTPSIKASGVEGLKTKSQTGGIPEAFACLFCVQTLESTSGSCSLSGTSETGEASWSLLTKWCLSRSGNCICYGIYSISYVLKWRNLRLAQG